MIARRLPTLIQLLGVIAGQQTVILLVNRCDSKITLQEHVLLIIQIKWLTGSWLREDCLHLYNYSALLPISK